MDPVSLIVAALVSGASNALAGTAEQAVKDAYSRLKALVGLKLGDGDDTAATLDREGPPTEEERSKLGQRLVAAGLDEDEEVIAAAQALMRRIDPAGAASGKYEVTISGGKGIVVGDGNTVTQNFD